jgi:hypothetical protein
VTYELTDNQGTVTLSVSFADEDIDLQGQIDVKGTDADALNYLPTFEGDLRRNYAYLWPLPVMPPMPPMGGM